MIAAIVVLAFLGAVAGAVGLSVLLAGYLIGG